MCNSHDTGQSHPYVAPCIVLWQGILTLPSCTAVEEQRACCAQGPFWQQGLPTDLHWRNSSGGFLYHQLRTRKALTPCTDFVLSPLELIAITPFWFSMNHTHKMLYAKWYRNKWYWLTAELIASNDVQTFYFFIFYFCYVSLRNSKNMVTK